MEKEIVENLCEKYRVSKDFVRLLLKICEDNNLKNEGENIEEVCQKVCQKRKIKQTNIKE